MGHTGSPSSEAGVGQLLFTADGNGGGRLAWRVKAAGLSPILRFDIIHRLEGRLWQVERVCHDGLAIPTARRYGRLPVGRHTWGVMAVTAAGHSAVSAKRAAFEAAEALSQPIPSEGGAATR